MTTFPAHYRDTGGVLCANSGHPRADDATPCPNGCDAAMYHYANDGHNECATDAPSALLPVERLALAVALTKVRRGEELHPNIAASCVLTLARITGRGDYTKGATT